jgi:sensor histidine kinase YesM
MKKLTLFNICILSLFFVFEALLYSNKLGSFGTWASAHDIYICLFFVLSVFSSVAIGYFKCRKAKVKQGPEAWAAGNAQMRSNLKKVKRNVWRDTIPLLIFLICTQVITFSHLDKSLTLLLTIGLTLIFMVVVTSLSWARRRNYKLGIEKAQQHQENISLKLRSIRSQLNPHFMFNALTSIQNLMNKNDIPAANHYLTLFADLTRKVLNTGEQDLISLADELKIQEDYLQMEQLRFGFKFNIQVSGAINTDNTEIPAMLLQPFVENAVKHGVGANGQNGTINITIDKQDNNLILAVADNGKGFDRTVVQNQTTSFGLKLSEQRIELLNQLNKDQPVTLNIDSTPTGTRVTITLVDLLA